MTVSPIAQMSPMRTIVLRTTSALASTFSGEVLKKTVKVRKVSAL